MFDIGFSEVLLIFVIALVVLGPEKLPRLASQVGRWIGRARAMARQFREQLEEEVNLEEVRKAQQEAKKSAPAAAASPPVPATQIESQAQPGAQPEAQQAPVTFEPIHRDPDPVDFRADTFSHAAEVPVPAVPDSAPAASTNGAHHAAGSEAYADTTAPTSGTTHPHNGSADSPAGVDDRKHS
jgi:sec-independent protein translocase protein TatB